MKILKVLFLGACICLLPTSLVAQTSTEDYSLLSQGNLEPPPPPAGYGSPIPELAPVQPPSPPMLPQRTGSTPPAANFSEKFVRAPKGTEFIQGISIEQEKRVARLIRSLYTCRTVIDNPESAAHLRRIYNIGNTCTEILGLAKFPVATKFSVSSRDRVIRDRSYGAVEYRNFGDFDHRLNGWVKPINTAVYVDLIFEAKGRRRSHVRAQFTRTGTFTGTFYAYGWDKYSRPWKLQGQLKEVLTRDNGLPSMGSMEIYGADPTGKTMKLALDFPIRIIGMRDAPRKQIRHRYGVPVHIGK